MIVNQATLTAISKSFSKIFNDALGSTETTYRKIAIVIENVKSITVDYAWLGGTPKMREWIGDRVLNDLKVFGYSITKKDYEATIEVDRDAIEYDQLGVVKPRIEQLAHEGDQHYDETLFELLEANANCYDGKPFFATNHDISGTAFSNLGTKELTQASFLAGREEMRGLVGDTGKSLKIKPNLLLIPPELEATAIKILKASTIDGGDSNITQDMAEYLVVDDLTDAKAWYLMDVTKPIRPLVLQINKPIKFTAMDSVTDESVFMRKSFRYGTDSQDNVGYGLWQLAYKSTGAVA
jgi:phage major head subunit gpT-like protein